MVGLSLIALGIYLYRGTVSDGYIFVSYTAAVVVVREQLQYKLKLITVTLCHTHAMVVSIIMWSTPTPTPTAREICPNQGVSSLEETLKKKQSIYNHFVEDGPIGRLIKCPTTAVSSANIFFFSTQTNLFTILSKMGQLTD